MAQKKTVKEKTAKKAKRRRKPAGVATGLAPGDMQGAVQPIEVSDLQREVDANGGRILGAYREPYGGSWVAIAALPIDQVEPTPYQRNLSEAHVRKLETAIGRLGCFLDPIVVVRAQGATDPNVRYWTPNGHHRLSAMRTLGAKSITALIVPDSAVAYRILALNTEKAHNLRERALEVIRMYRELARLNGASEATYALEFEEPALITLGLCYEERPRFSGGAYHPILKRVDQFLKRPLSEALEIRNERATSVLELDDLIVGQVDALKAKGMTSPYLKSFVVARVNPVRFRPKGSPPLGFDDAIERMMKAAAKFNPEKIKVEDLARTGGPLEESG